MTGPCWGCGTPLEIREGNLFETQTNTRHSDERCEQIIESSYHVPELEWRNGTKDQISSKTEVLMVKVTT